MNRLLSVTLALLVQMMLAAHALAMPGSNELTLIANLTVSLDQKYAAGSITTLEQAEIALKESNAAQLRLQSWYEQSERACHQTFFVNDCLSDVKLQRRLYIVSLQRIALEAKALQRKLRIDQLDKELAQKQIKP
ncbi:MAG: hypothetical protein WA071_18165 [Undibacterium umbellatum]|uniref:hypothetical protein n=1 Tax=Undibacterium umbellatum TaxID=2762300 RepID=UPI003BB4C7F1